MSIKYLVDQQLTKVILRPHMYSCQQANHSQVKSDFFQIICEISEEGWRGPVKKQNFFVVALSTRTFANAKDNLPYADTCRDHDKKIIFTAFK